MSDMIISNTAKTPSSSKIFAELHRGGKVSSKCGTNVARPSSLANSFLSVGPDNPDKPTDVKKFPPALLPKLTAKLMPFGRTVGSMVSVNDETRLDKVPPRFYFQDEPKYNERIR